ncbi:MAG TPA: hypothetical protein VJU82_06130, partial [Acidobacteriaceae bacterium]|nr:hypothetical protein [Acidobacteriaceae bacterium]
MLKIVFRSRSMVLALGLFAAGLLSGSAPAQSFPTDPGQYVLDVYALRGPQDTSAKLYLSVVTRN